MTGERGMRKQALVSATRLIENTSQTWRGEEARAEHRHIRTLASKLGEMDPNSAESDALFGELIGMEMAWRRKWQGDEL